MPIPFEEVRFPDNISYGSKGGPVFSTDIFTSVSGEEQRNVNWSKARAVYDVSYGIRDRADINTMLAHFYSMRGRATGFRYKDWTDYTITDQLVGTGDGTTTAFQLVKTYTSGTLSYTRTLQKIVADTVTVKVNDVVTTAFTINLNTGVLTMNSPPTSGHTVKVSCEFDVPVRYDTDQLDITEEAWELGTIPSIPLVEIRPSNA